MWCTHLILFLRERTLIFYLTFASNICNSDGILSCGSWWDKVLPFPPSCRRENPNFPSLQLNKAVAHACGK